MADCGVRKHVFFANCVGSRTTRTSGCRCLRSRGSKMCCGADLRVLDHVGCQAVLMPECANHARTIREPFADHSRTRQVDARWGVDGLHGELHWDCVCAAAAQAGPLFAWRDRSSVRYGVPDLREGLRDGVRNRTLYKFASCAAPLFIGHRAGGRFPHGAD